MNYEHIKLFIFISCGTKNNASKYLYNFITNLFKTYNQRQTERNWKSNFAKNYFA